MSFVKDGYVIYKVKNLERRLTVSVNFFDEFLKDLLVKGLPHHSKDVSDEVTWDTARAVVVEAIERFAKNCNKLALVKKTE